MRNTLFAVLLSVSLLGCTTKHNPASCCSNQAQCDSFGLGQVTGCESDKVCDDTGTCQSPQCETSAECTSPDAPLCVGHLCVALCQADADCAGIPGNAFCDVPTGACVGCVDSSDCANPTPTCDATALTCRACGVDADCASTVCDVDQGTCSAATDVIYASPDGVATGDCSQATPCSIADALSLVTVQKSLVRMLPGSYATSIDMVGTVATTIVGTGATLAGATGAGLSMEQSSNLTVRGLDINTPGSEAVHCTPAAGTAVLSLRDLSIVPGAGLTSARASGCTLTLQHVDLGPDGSISPTNSNLMLDRTRLGDIVTTGSGVSNVTITATNSLFIGRLSFTSTQITAAHISFSTFPNGLGCPGTTPSPALVFDNDIFYSTTNADAINASSCTYSYEIAFPQPAPTGGTNMIIMDPEFVDPASDGTGDYHTLGGSPAIDAADPVATDAFDYDGTSRPQGAGRDIGAFEYKP